MEDWRCLRLVFCFMQIQKCELDFLEGTGSSEMGKKVSLLQSQLPLVQEESD